jgi:exonuclease III
MTQAKKDMRFTMWNASNLYRAGLRVTVAKEISKYKIDLVGIQEVRLDSSGTEPGHKYTFFCGKGNENHELGRDFFCTQGNHISS